MGLRQELLMSESCTADRFVDQTARRKQVGELGERVIDERVFAWWDYPIFLALTLMVLMAAGNFIVHWLYLDDFRSHTIIASGVMLLLLANIGMMLSRWALMPLMRKPEPMEPLAGLRVGVATTFVPGAESIKMLEQTVHALVSIDYPHDTWVLDEGDDPEVIALCRRLGALHFTRKGIERYQAAEGRFAARTKHGNYNAWLDSFGFEMYEVIVNFDPDHVPSRDFLTRSIGYLRDPDIGYVQSAQAYYNQAASFVARGAAEETYAFYSSIQMTSYALGYPIVVGCHTVHRTTALREIGGFAPHDADDLLITVYYRSHGWRGVYVPEILAYGLTPVDWPGYLQQQRRWARSTLDIKFRIFAHYTSQLPLVERLIGWAHGLYYLQGLTSAVLLCVTCFVLISGIQLSVISAQSIGPFFLLLTSIQLAELYRQRFFLAPRHEVGLHLRAAVLAAAKWPYVFLALVDVIFGRKNEYQLTSKMEQVQRATPLLLPNLLVILMIAVCWLTGLALGSTLQTGVRFYILSVISGSALLIASTALRYPAPFEDKNRNWLADRVEVDSSRPVPVRQADTV
jgi:cellulose synthase (UDP-forming)